MKHRILKTLAVMLAAVLLFTVLPVSDTAVQAADTKKSGSWEYMIDGKTAVIVKYLGSKTKVTVPSKLGGKKVTKLGEEAFSGNKSVETVIIPKTITEIGPWCFSDCENLTKVTFKKGIKLTKIGKSAFANCYSLTTIKLPNTLKELGDKAFSKCLSLKTMTIPAKTTTLGENVFNQCENLESVTIKAKIKTLPDSFFWECYYLEKITLPSSIEVIESAAFGCCESLEEIILPANTVKVGYHAFFDCQNLDRVVFGSKVKEIGGEIFYSQCYNLESIVLPASLEIIHEKMLSGITDDVKNYLVIEAPEGSKAAQWALAEGFNVKYTD